MGILQNLCVESFAAQVSAGLARNDAGTAQFCSQSYIILDANL